MTKYAGLIVFFLLLSFSSDTRAHSWYPRECCSGQDCAQVDTVTWLGTRDDRSAHMVVTSKAGTVAVPHDFPVRLSRDERMHVCIRDVWLICLFLPPLS